MDLEEEREFLGLTCLHDLADAKDGGEVAGQDADDDWLGGERSGATDIMSKMVRKLGEGDVLEDEVGEGSHDGKRENTVNAKNRSCPGPSGHLFVEIYIL